MVSSRPSTRTKLVVLAVAALVTFAVAAPVAAPAEPQADEAPAAMSWWGYWVGRKGDTAPGTKYLRQRQAKKMKTNIVLVHAGRDPGELEKLRAGFEVLHEKQQNVGVVLMLDNILRKPADPNDNRCYYNEVDYQGWDQRLTELSNEMHRAGPDGWRPVDDIVAIAGFDEANVNDSLCFTGVGGAPQPIPYAMQLARQYFPEIPDRGHVWMLGPDPFAHTPPNAATLEGSTLTFAYHYAAYGNGPWDPTAIPYCPQEGTYPPAAPLPEGSLAKLDQDRLRTFVEEVNAVRGNTDTPVVFIPYSNRRGQRPFYIAVRGVACTLTTLWYHTRCVAATGPPSWADQVRGFLGWQWDNEPTVIDPDTGTVVAPGWIGTQKSAPLKQAGKWIGRNLAAPACTPSP